MTEPLLKLKSKGVNFVRIQIEFNPFDRWHGSNYYTGDCGTLLECFSKNEVRDFYRNEQIAPVEFEEFLNTLSEHIDSSKRRPWDLGRSFCDTPFYDGNPVLGSPLFARGQQFVLVINVMTRLQ